MLSIAAFGTYGSGKTSLLKTLVRETNLRRKRSETRGFSSARVYALPLIEPNILAKDDNFLYAFLATALEEDLKHQDREERLASGSYRLSPVQQAFHKVSEYLQVIDPEKEAQESDPLGKSLERLDRHSSGFLLEREMKKFISVLADELTSQQRSSVVLLAVDDVDMSQENLIRILDTYRRYLQHPRLVPAFTFTSRLAEELLGVHFSEKLSTAKSQEIAERRREGDTTTSLNLTEHLAYQYLVKLFPIRNRIRLGPAPARVQRSCFIPPNEGTWTNAPDTGDRAEPKARQVMDLLERASKLLFGHSEWPLTPQVRLSLRPSTLRRQLQVIDAMVDARVDELPWTSDQLRRLQELENQEPGETAHDDLTWTAVFSRAAWSHLNVHRDVLREVGLHMENLYSWTPRGLRRAILGGILTLDPRARETLIKRWRYRVEGRRGQILSLLALVAFRPEMRGEEPSGDHPDLTREGPKQPFKGCRWNLKVTQGTLWLISLWTGFYLPQLLSRGRQLAESPKATGSQRIVGTGWSLRTGAVYAMREARESREIFATGMMRLDPKEVAARLNHFVETASAAKEKDFRELEDEIGKLQEQERQSQADKDPSDSDGDPSPGEPKSGDQGESSGSSSVEWSEEDKKILEEKRTKRRELIEPHEPLLHFHLWCFYGYSEGKPWAAISLWRGLGLLGQILEDLEGLTSSQDGVVDRERLKYLILKHASWTRRPGLFKKRSDSDVTPSTGFKPWDLESAVAQAAASQLADQLAVWLEPFVGEGAGTLDPLLRVTSGNAPPDSTSEQERLKWECCFIRRLQGEYLVGQLWPLLGGAYLSPVEKRRRLSLRGTDEWNARRALGDWLKALQNYMDTGVRGKDDDSLWTGNEIFRFLSTCPLLAPWSKEVSEKTDEKPPAWIDVFEALPVWEGSEPEPSKHRVDFEWPSSRLTLGLANSSGTGSQPFKVLLEPPEGTKKSEKTTRKKSSGPGKKGT